MTLTEFLLARLAEVEAIARVVNVGIWYPWDDRNAELYAAIRSIHPEAAVHIRAQSPACVLADVEAKRRIVDRCKYAVESDGWMNDYDMFDAGEQAFGTLLDLARPYADHPDFDPSWDQPLN